MWPQVIDLFSSKQAGIAGMASMHDYCFLPCMWPQVIDLFPSKKAGIVGMTVSFSIARGIAWPE